MSDDQLRTERTMKISGKRSMARGRSMTLAHRTRILVMLSALLALCLTASLLADEGASGPVQLLTGRVDADEVVFYHLSGLKQGQQLMVRIEATSGNLDPAFGIASGAIDATYLEGLYEEADEIAASKGGDPIAAMEALRIKYFLAFDDDGGGGLTAALQFDVPADGDYEILVAGTQKAVGRETFGNYRLMLGIDRPDVLDGSAQPSGAAFARRNLEATPPGVGVDELTGSLGGAKKAQQVPLLAIKEGDSLYARLETTDGELMPSLQLNNFAGKAVRSSNLDGSSPSASLQYTFPDDAENYQLKISACCNEGNYRLLVGINEPDVLGGSAEVDGRPIIRRPIAIKMGLQLEQIIEVNQPLELFNVVALLRMQWRDPALAFNPEHCQCDTKTLHDLGLDQFIAASEGRWPAISFRNQQGKRWSQNRVAVIHADGSVNYAERFTSSFQVDFDFRQFPFDTQAFLIHIDAIGTEEQFLLEDPPGISGISTGHGEDEFILTAFDTSITSQKYADGETSASFTFRFEAPRHLSYYVFRIFVPISLLVLVSWFTFFLRDYKHRIEVTSANLLVFIAFSFSIAGNYPRLGYLTFLDAVMAVMFVMSALIVVYNVSMKRLEIAGQDNWVHNIDNFMDWMVPVMFMGALGIMIYVFFY